MSEIRLNIDGKEVRGFAGQTILNVARENGIGIPTLCHDERVEMYGSCGLCVVEVEGTPKLLRSCSTLAANGMVVATDTERLRKNRQAALELLLSDHTGDCRPPCVLACPAQTDCQGYVGLIANGEYEEALQLVKDKIPFPASIGRVCPHPCEEACRRTLVEEPISIAALKQFVGDLDLEQGELYAAEPGSPTGKRIAIVGGGPGGLTAAYFLRMSGHEVTVYDAMPKMGGMLRYGIPEYRLPKGLLQEEVGAIEKMGVTFRNNVKVGRDVTLDYLRGANDAVIVAVGAWSSTGLRCPGEEREGVLGGIDFLREVSTNDPSLVGKRVAVVGGGNTAMDACRTAVRLGASEVYNIYRRTINEMPAEEIEIEEAQEEGVVFKNLTNPIEVVGDDEGRVKAVRLQIMELGEPDASGRRAPVPVEGKEETIGVDYVIVAIGQKLAAEGLEAIEQTKWKTIAADEGTYQTNLDGVFAIGDATNKGADIAISAIGEGKGVAGMVDRYLDGEALPRLAEALPRLAEPYLVRSEKTAEDFADRGKEPRAKAACREADVRRNDFKEVGMGLNEEEARREASRCLECGCLDYFECKLIDYANQYDVNPEKYKGKTHRHEVKDDHPHIRRNPDKCILCGLCVRFCDEVVGATALGLVDRGFDTVVKPALDMSLNDTDCIGCGQCVYVCPTGALTETMMVDKQVPLREMVTDTVCASCSVGCKTRLTSRGTSLLRNLPSSEKDALICEKGRFGFGDIGKKERLFVPLVGGEETSVEEAMEVANRRLLGIKNQYGAEAIAVAISGRHTNEEARAIKQYANDALGTDNVFSFGLVDGGLADVLGKDASTATMDELENAELIVMVGSDPYKNHAVAGMKMRRAAKRGAKLLLVGVGESLLDGVAAEKVGGESYISHLEQVVKALLDDGKGKAVEGREEWADALKDVAVGEEARKMADGLGKVRKAIFVYEKEAVTVEAMRLVAKMAVLSGHDGKPRDGVLQLLSDANAQGLVDLGVESGEFYRKAMADGKIRGLFIFGEEVEDVESLECLDFLAVQGLHWTETAKKADVAFPAASFAEVDGSFTSADGKVQAVKRAIARPDSIWDNVALVEGLADYAG